MQPRTSMPLIPTERLYVVFPTDRIDLAQTFHRVLQEAGLPVALAREDAALLLTGAYDAIYDVWRYRFNWLQVQLVRQQTGQTIATFRMEQGGLNSAETSVRKLVQELKTLY